MSEELKRAVKRLTYPDLGYDSEGDLMGWLVAKDDLRLILSERAELLATVEGMRAGLEGLVTAVCYADPPQNFARAGDEPNLCHVARVPVDFIAEARAALTTGEEK